ncbi:MAG: hypothetical protein HY049_18395 [Acidobacteria bacterium]|nr:hypothetical protein [Acidobacteriota bacterium]
MTNRHVAVALTAIGFLAAMSARAVAAVAAEKAAPQIPINIEPGPSVMSDAEKAMVFDAEGSRHAGVILLEESLRDDVRGGDPQIPGRKPEAAYGINAFHRRAKILSADARELANVEIFLADKAATVVQWWGRTILPDGKVLELKREALTEIPVIKYGRNNQRAFRGALVGVEPGCVIDYGWVVRTPTYPWMSRVILQHRWPVQRTHHEWNPNPYLRTGCLLSRASGMDLHASQRGHACVVDGRDLPPATEEPYMPPDAEVRPAATFAYALPVPPGENVWDFAGKFLETQLHEFAPSDRRALKALEETHVAPDGPPGGKARAIHDWMARNLEQADYPGSDPSLSPARHNAEIFGTFDRVFAEKRGNPLQLAMAFAVLVRAAGEEANLALAPDRSEHDWDPRLLTLSQFEELLVATKAPGAAIETAAVSAPVSGLPFGQIPWWTAGGKALVETATGHKEITLAASAAEDNVARTEGTVTFDGSGDALVKFTRAQSGQSGYSDRRNLPTMSESARRDALERVCGAGPDFDVSESAFTSSGKSPDELTYRCEGRVGGAGAATSSAARGFSLDGPWHYSLPDVTSSVRYYPIVLQFPRSEILRLTISPGEGFVATELPEAISLDPPFGHFSFSITQSSGAYVVRRELSLKLARLDASDYDRFREFLLEVRLADRTQLRFVKSGAPRS